MADFDYLYKAQIQQVMAMKSKHSKYKAKSKFSV